MTRIAVFGLGVMGRQHVRVLTGLDDVEIVAACDTSSAARDSAASVYGVPTMERWEDALELRPDAVVNALPTHLHFEATKPLVEQGAHVLVEKPIATDVVAASELVEIAARHGVALMVGHTERFNPAVRAARAYVASGALGEIVSMSARRVGVARPAIPAVGVAIDLAIHDIDVFSYLLDETPGELLFAAGAALHGNLVEDHVDLVLRYGETLASIQANWITPVKVRRLNITGTAGVAEVDYLRQKLQVLDSVPALIEGSPANFFAVSRESTPTDIHVEANEPLRAELEEFVAVVREPRAPIVPTSAAVRALALAVESTATMRRTSHPLAHLEAAAAVTDEST